VQSCDVVAPYGRTAFIRRCAKCASASCMLFQAVRSAAFWQSLRLASICDANASVVCQGSGQQCFDLPGATVHQRVGRFVAGPQGSSSRALLFYMLRCCGLVFRNPKMSSMRIRLFTAAMIACLRSE